MIAESLFTPSQASPSGSLNFHDVIDLRKEKRLVEGEARCDWAALCPPIQWVPNYKVCIAMMFPALCTLLRCDFLSLIWREDRGLWALCIVSRPFLLSVSCDC